MVFCRIPLLARLIAGRYQDIFRDAGISHSMLCLLIVMTLSGIPVLSEFVRFVSFSPSVSTLSRNIGKFTEETMNRAQRRIAWSVLKQVKRNEDDWIWVIDTTSNIKRTAALEGRGLWANSKAEIFFGQNMMMLCAINKKTGASIPIHWRPCLKSEERAPGTTNHSLVLHLIDAILEKGWPKLPLALDSWFDSAKLFSQLNDRKIIFMIQLKSSRKPKTNPNPRSPKKSLLTIFTGMKRSGVRATTRESIAPSQSDWKNLKFISGSVLWISGSGETSKQIQIKVAAVFNNPNEHKAFGYYATNDLSKPYTWCWNMSRYRWNVEVGFRDLRQGFEWGKFAAKTPEGANFSWTMPIIILAYLREKSPETPILSQLRELKYTETMASIDFHAEKPRSSQREMLRIRLLGTPSNKKVRITAAEKEEMSSKSNLSAKNAA